MNSAAAVQHLPAATSNGRAAGPRRDPQKFQEDPHWRDYPLFYEYFHGDTGAGLGASHQTGWTGRVARIMQTFADADARTLLETGQGKRKIGNSIAAGKDHQNHYPSFYQINTRVRLTRRPVRDAGPPCHAG